MPEDDSTRIKRSHLSAERQSLLDQRVRRALDRAHAKAVSGEQAVAGIVPLARTGDLPLSFGQERLWFLDQLDPGNSAFNISAAWRLRGALHVGALERSFNAIVQRHEILRTTFAVRDGQPIQIISPTLTIPFELIDLREAAQADRERLALELVAEHSQRPFDLARGPLLRNMLVQLDERVHIVCLTMHHSISDAWSFSILIQEFGALYSGFVAGAPVALPELAIQYADFAAWQRQWLHGGGEHTGSPLQTQLAYWRAQLSGRLPVLDLPTDHPRPTVPRACAARHSFSISERLTRALHMLSRQAGVTLFMTMLAAFQTLLLRYTGQDDIIVGVPIANRPHRQLETLIGFFVNILPLRTSLSGDPSFRQLLDRVRETTIGAYAHQDLPFEKLVEDIQPTRDTRRQPLLQTMFNLHNMPAPAIDLAELAIENVAINTGATDLDLTMEIVEGPASLSGWFNYNSELFEADTIARLAGHLRVLLEAITADPARRLMDLPLLAENERHQLLVEWNDTESGVRGQGSGVSACLHQLVAAQAARAPDAVAIVFDETKDERRKTKDEDSASSLQPPASSLQQLSHAELDRRANQVAHELRARGVGPDVLVGICMERSLELVVALLGVLKAGGAYLPLDPSYPLERLTFMVEDSRAAVLITQASIYDLRFTIYDLGQPEGAIANRKSKIVNINADWPAISRQPANAPASTVVADNLAYVIYTSGSTGQPKGAMNSHGAIVNRLLWMQDAFQLTPDDRVLQKTPFSFDVSVWEFFWPLLAGATLVLARPGGHQEADYLVRLIARSRISTLHFVPSMLRLFLEAPGVETCRTLRRVVCSGEALSSQDQQRFFARLSAGLYNLYGPTEAAIDVSHWSCQPGQAWHTPPIGRPVANTQLYVLDQRLEPASIGVPGELYIGGVQLARGYLNRPELTAARFIPNPFADCKLQIADCRLAQSAICNLQSAMGTRLYKTGDLARYRADGAIEFLGRRDDQVKLRGFRIELGEIEAALLLHPTVSECAVALREDAPGDTRLVAYVVPTTDDRRPTTDDATDKETRRQGDEAAPNLLVSLSPGLLSQSPSFLNGLRDYLRQTLPEYMLPSAFMPLDALPLTPSGKLDRRALPAPDTTRPASPQPFVAPRTPVERQLAAIWCEILRIDQVGIYDNFFALGGHSLLLTRLASQIQALFQVELSLRTLFDAPTIVDMTVAIATHQLAQEDPAEIARMLEEVRDWPDEELQALLNDFIRP